MAKLFNRRNFTLILGFIVVIIIIISYRMMALPSSSAAGGELEKPRVGLNDLSLKKIMYLVQSL